MVRNTFVFKIIAAGTFLLYSSDKQNFEFRWKLKSFSVVCWCFTRVLSSEWSQVSSRLSIQSSTSAATDCCENDLKISTDLKSFGTKTNKTTLKLVKQDLNHWNTFWSTGINIVFTYFRILTYCYFLVHLLKSKVI